MPVCSVCQQSKVGEGFLGGAELALALGELVAEGDEEAAEALALVLGEGQDAGHVVALGGFFLLGEVADQVAAVRVAGAHAVEEEGVDVVVESFVVEEELGEEAEVAAPGALAAPVDFEEGDVVVAVDLVAGWVEHGAFGAVAFEGFARGKVGEAEFVEVDELGVGERLRVRGEVPGFDFVFAHLDAGEVADEVELSVVLHHGATRAELFHLFFWVGGDFGFFGLHVDGGVAHFRVAIFLWERGASGGGGGSGAG